MKTWGRALALSGAAIEATGYENKTLRNAKWVAGSFELSMRMDNLSWTHHQIVAALPVEERTAILAAAEREGWTRQIRGTSKNPLCFP